MCVVYVCTCAWGNQNAYYAYALFYKALLWTITLYTIFRQRFNKGNRFSSNFQNSNLVYDKCISRHLKHYYCVLPDSPTVEQDWQLAALVSDI